MKRTLNSYLLPHFVVWGIVALLVYTVVFRGPSLVINAVALCIGICLTIFAAKISLWWNERINEQGKVLADYFKVSSKSARIMLYGGGTRLTNAWAFRIYGFLVALLSAYHLYNQYLTCTLSQGMDNKDASNIMIFILGVFFLYRWMVTTKGMPYRKSIVKTGICWLIVLISYVLSILLHGVDIRGILALISIVAFIAFWIFLVKTFPHHRALTLWAGNS